MTTFALRSLLLGSVALVACGSGDATSSPDAARPADASDASADAPPVCPVPAARLGDTAEARRLAESPARCGQPAYRWVADARLGAVTTVGTRATYAASLLQAIASGAGITLPAPLRHDVAVDQVAYTTQDRGALLDATTLVAYPRNLREAASFEVLLVLHGTAGFHDACAPSLTTDARALAGALASAGYVVVAPDYIGLRGVGVTTGFPHPYLVGTAAAVASLDAVRAGLRHVAAQGSAACARPRFVTIGGSQGGHAALWVDRVAAHYAPELELAGTVATVPPADMEGETNRALRMNVQATANVMAFFTVAAPWYGLASRLGEVFRAPWAADLPMVLATQCSPGDRVREATREAVFTQPVLDAAATAQGIRSLDPWGCLVTENGLTTTTVPRGAQREGYGMLWVLGERDLLVDTATERASFEALCRQGYRMQFLECQGASHTQATTWALPEVLEFARARFDGRPVDAASSCMLSPPTRCRGTPMGS